MPTEMGERLEWITERERLEAIARAWDELAARDGSIFARHGWLTCWWDAFGSPWELRVATLWREEQLVAALPLSVRGRRARALADVHSPVFRPLALDAAARRAIVAAALDAAPSELIVRAVSRGDPALELLHASSEQLGRITLVQNGDLAPIVELSGSWADYRQRMKSKWGSVERKGRKMRREHDAEFVVVEAPTDPEAQLERCFRVERSGWKGAAGTAILDSEDKLAFYRSVGRVFAASGHLRLSGIVLDGQLVAFDLALLDAGRLFSLKTGYEDGYSQLSPGMVLRRAIIERCFELGLETHELLGDDMAWKRRFATTDRRQVVFRSYDHSPAGLARYGYHRSVRPRLRRLYPRLQAARARVRRRRGREGDG